MFQTLFRLIMNKDKCPLCGKKAEDNLSGLRNYYYCTNCALGWMKKFPKAVYDATYYEGKSGLAQKLFGPIANMFYSIRSMYAGEGKKKLWIDVGAGDGGYLRTVPSEKKLGVEVSKAGRKIMEKNGIKTMSNNDFLKANNLKADVISFWHVLEHVDKPMEYLKAARRNLSKNGVIVIGIPNIRSLEFKVFKKYWFHLVPDFHLWHFSIKSMKKTLEATGYEIKDTDYWSLEHNPTGILQSFINSTAHSDSVLHRLVKRGLKYKIKFKDLFWSVFWMTIGLPVIIIFWILGTLICKPGTFVTVAYKE